MEWKKVIAKNFKKYLATYPNVCKMLKHITFCHNRLVKQQKSFSKTATVLNKKYYFFKDRGRKRERDRQRERERERDIEILNLNKVQLFM